MRIIRSSRIVSETAVIDGYLKIDDGKIKAVTIAPQGGSCEDYSDYTIIPGIFDSHTHGMHGFSMDTQYDPVEQERHVKGYLKGMATIGSTSVLPIAKPFAFEAMYKWMREKDAPSRVIGINNEGPYGNRSGEKGKSRPTRPIDIQDVKNIIAASHGMIKVMSFAPELENAEEMIQVLQENNIQPAIGHSNINAEEAKAWFKKGITGLTHLGNAMTGIHHRDVGCLGVSMLDENVWCELITDGRHLCNDMLSLIFKVKPKSRICLISDGAPIGGLPEGDYPSYFDPSMKVHIDKDGFILEETGRISGSGVSVLKGMKNIVENTGVSLEEACRMASLNPALRYGSAACKGSLAVSKDADFVVIDKDFTVIETVLEGRTVYRKGDKLEYNL